MKIFFIRVIAADRVYYEGRCESIILPSVDGSIGILANHENAIIAVSEGEIEAKLEGGRTIHAFVGKGFFQIMNNRCLLLVESVESPEEIDVRRAQEAEERALEQLRQKLSIREYYHNQASLARAMTRLKTANKHHDVR